MRMAAAILLLTDLLLTGGEAHPRAALLEDASAPARHAGRRAARAWDARCFCSGTGTGTAPGRLPPEGEQHLREGLTHVQGRGGCGSWPLRGRTTTGQTGVCIEMGWRHGGRATLYFGCCVSGTARRLVRGSTSTTTTTTTHFTAKVTVSPDLSSPHPVATPVTRVHQETEDPQEKH